MGLIDKLFGKKSESVAMHQSEPSPFTEYELAALAKEIDETHDRVMNDNADTL